MRRRAVRQALDQPVQQAHRDVLLVDHRAELVLPQDETAHRCGRRHRRGPHGLADRRTEERDFTEVVAGTERAYLLAVADDVSPALEDDEEFVARLSLPAKERSRRILLLHA